MARSGAIGMTISAHRPLTIVICDDHPIVGQALRAQLESELNAQVQLGASFFQAHAAAAALPTLDMWILDINLPGEDIVRNVAQARALFPDAAIVVFSGSEDPDQLRRAAGLGINAFVPKSMSPDLLLAVLRRVIAGERYFPDMDWMIGQSPSGVAPCADAAASALPALGNGGAARLTDRQQSVLRELAKGKSNKEIARSLAISPMTVKVHLAQIFGTLGVSNRTEAVMAAARMGLLP